MSGIGKRIRDVRQERGLSLQALANQAGVGAYQTIQDLERGKSQGTKHIMALARALAVDPQWLETGTGAKDLPKERAEDLSRNSPRSGEEALTYGTLNVLHFPRDLPILGSGSCGEDGLFEFNGQTLDHARRPPRLQNVNGAYALYTAGLSMSPWREPGQLVYVHPHQPVKIGDYVVVQLHPETAGEPPKAYIKKLLRRTEKDLKLLQFTPREELTIPMKRVKAVHRVIDWDELLGL